MKVIKKYFKVVLCFVAFMLCSFLLAFAPTMSAYASLNYAQDQYNLAINSINMPKLVDVQGENKELKIPYLDNTKFGASFKNDETYKNYTIRVIDPAGHNHDFVVDSKDSAEKTGTNSYFTRNDNNVKVNVLTNGEYRIVYIIKTIEGTGNNAVEKLYYSNTYSVEVKNVSYELDFSVQSGENAGWINLFPKEIATDANRKIEIPVPVAKVVGADDTVDVKTLDVDTYGEVKVSRNGVEQTLNADGSDFIKDTDGKYKFIPSQSGVYKIQYTYKRGVNRPTKTITITVTDGFVAPTKLEVTTAPTFPEISLGKTGITLPKLTAKTENADNVEYNVVSIRVEHEDNSNIYQELKNNNYTLNMTIGEDGFDKTALELDNLTYSDLKGNYTITYNLKDAYGNETSYTKRLESVTVTQKPEIYMSYDYDATGSMKDGTFKVTESEVNTDYATNLKTKYGYDEVILPAAYATDAVSESTNDLIVVRTMRSVESGTIYYIDNLKYNSKTGQLEEVTSGSTGFNYATENVGNINKAVQFKFANDTTASDYDGTYQLEYHVYAKNIKERSNSLYVTGSTRYSITVLDHSLAPEDETTPTVEITNVKNGVYVDTSKDLTVNLTATDDDTRLKNAVFYYYGSEVSGDFGAALKTAITNATLNNKKHVLDQDAILDELTAYDRIQRAELNDSKDGYVVNYKGIKNTDTKAVIVAVTYNDFENIDVDVKTINFKNTTESVAPDYEITAWGDFDSDTTASDNLIHNYKTLNDIELGDTVELPTIQFNDWSDNTKTSVHDKNLEVRVNYYIDSPETENAGLQYKSPYGKVFTQNAVKGGTIKATKAGTYFVVYSAMDDAGNTTVVYFTFSVKDTTKPLLSINVTGDESVKTTGNTVTAEVGSTINFDAIVKDGTTNENVTENATVLVTVDDNGEGLDYYPTNEDEMSYIFKTVGNYTVTFTANYDGRPSVTKVLYVNIEKVTLKWMEEFEIQEYASVNSDVFLPDIAASHNAKVKVEVTAPNGTKLGKEVTKTEDNGVSVWMFGTNSTKGKYTIKYIATTADETLEKSFTLRVGDNVPPTFSMEHEADLKQNIVYTGSQIEYKIDVNTSKRTLVITASSNGEQIYSYDTGLVINDKDDTKAEATPMYWSKLDVEFLKGDTVLTAEDGKYFIDAEGTYSIRLTIEDDYQNEAVKTITFKVVKQTEEKEDNDAVVGIVLIVISLVVLAGVILFFLFTGKKGGSKKSKTTKKVVKTESKEDSKVEQPIVEETEKVEDNAETQEVEENAKEGEIEE